MPQLLLATRNEGKIREYRYLLDGCGWELVTPQEVGLDLPDEEVGDTYEANAKIKAVNATALTGLVALACVVLGDSLSYAMGFYAREPVLHRWGTSARWVQARTTFQKWGGLSIVLTRFLITGIAVPVNLLAGTGNYPFRKFLMFDLLGEAVWIFGYGGVGYLFGAQWENASDVLNNISGLALGLVILLAGTWLGTKWNRSNK